MVESERLFAGFANLDLDGYLILAAYGLPDWLKFLRWSTTWRVSTDRECLNPPVSTISEKMLKPKRVH